MKKFVSLILAMVVMLTICIPNALAVDFMAQMIEISELEGIMGEYFPRCYTATYYRYGALAIMDDNEIGYFTEGNTEVVWRHGTDSERDFFMTVKEAYPNAEYDICAYAGNDVLSFDDDLSMEVEMSKVWTYEFGEDYLCFLSIEGGALALWTPYAYIIIATNGVYDAVINRDYLLFADKFGGHVVNARLSEVCKQTQAYLSFHPLPIVDLGENADIWDYYPELYWYDEYGLVDNTASFNEEFGIDFDAWGGAESSKHDFALSDFESFVTKPISEIINIFDVPIEMYVDPFVYNNITFNGHNGYLQFYRANDYDLKSIYWYDNEGTLTLDELIQLVEAAGGKFVRNDIPEDYGIEYVYELNGRFIHVGYTAEGGPTCYIYANNPYMVDE